LRRLGLGRGACSELEAATDGRGVRSLLRLRTFMYFFTDDDDDFLVKK
jgi:hypothetical protein